MGKASRGSSVALAVQDEAAYGAGELAFFLEGAGKPGQGRPIPGLADRRDASVPASYRSRIDGHMPIGIDQRSHCWRINCGKRVTASRPFASKRNFSTSLANASKSSCAVRFNRAVASVSVDARPSFCVV